MPRSFPFKYEGQSEDALRFGGWIALDLKTFGLFTNKEV